MPADPLPNRPAPSEDEIPEAPPPALQGRYLRASWSYLYWCVGMLAWSVLCVIYFVLTGQTLEMVIGICLGLLLLAMIVLPTVLFGGRTWYKRLGWITLLLGLFSLMFIYPLVVVVIGIVQRWNEGRYRHWLYYTDIIHLALSLLTVALSVWTILITVRVVRLVRALSRGDYEE